MINHEYRPLYPEFYEKVETIAYQAGNKWELLDWEDIRQSMWVWLYENPLEMERYMDSPNPTRELRKVANQVASAMTFLEDVSDSNFVYTPKYVRAMLKHDFLADDTLGMLSEQHDFQKGLQELKRSHPGYWEAIESAFIEGVKPEVGQPAMKLSRAIDKLTWFMNQNRVKELSVYAGPQKSEAFVPDLEEIEEFYGGDIDLYYSNNY